MTKKEKKYVLECINAEGFDYTFVDYCDFKDEVKDEEFHKLREAYLSAREQLLEYVGHEE